MAAPLLVLGYYLGGLALAALATACTGSSSEEKAEPTGDGGGVDAKGKAGSAPSAEAGKNEAAAPESDKAAKPDVFECKESPPLGAPTEHSRIQYVCAPDLKKPSPTQTFQTDNGELPNVHDEKWRKKWSEHVASSLVSQANGNIDAAMKLVELIDDTPTIQYWSVKDKCYYPYSFGNIHGGVREALSRMKQADSEAESSDGNVAILQGGPLTPAELKETPTDSAAGRFLHMVGGATSVLDLYDRILSSPHPDDQKTVGIIGKKKLDEWEEQMKKNPEFKISISEEDQKLMENLARTLGRNVKTAKRGDTQLAHEFFEGNPKDENDEGIRERLRMANNPEDNQPQPYKGDPGADKDTTTLNVSEINALTEYLDGWKTRETLELIAAYKTIIAYYKEAAGYNKGR